MGLAFRTQLCLESVVRERPGQMTGKEVRLNSVGSGDTLKDPSVEKIDNTLFSTAHVLLSDTDLFDPWLVYCLSSSGSQPLPRAKLHGDRTFPIRLCLEESLA